MSFTDIFGSNKPRCQHFLEDGSRCKADPQKDSKFCFMHDPNQKQKQHEARKKGGQMRFQPYERKMPASFKYSPPQEPKEVHALLDQIAIYYIQDEIDLRSARFLVYIVNSKLAFWNREDRTQYRTAKQAEQHARIMRREKDPWSPQYGAIARAEKEKEDAEKAAALSEDKKKTAAMPSDVALSFRELEELKNDYEKKGKERAAARKRLAHWKQKEDHERNNPNAAETESEPAPPKRPPTQAQLEEEQRQ